jgi:PmbA protein
MTIVASAENKDADPKEIAGYLLKNLSKQVDDVIISLSNTKKTQLKFANSNIVATQSWQSRQIEMFISYKKRILTTQLLEFSKKSADELVKKAMAFVKTLEPKEEYAGIAKGPFKYKKSEKGYDKKIAEMDSESVGIVESAMNSAVEQGAKRCAGVFEFTDSSEYLLGSNSVEAEQKGTGVYLSVRAFCEKDASGYCNEVGTTLNGFKPERAGSEAGATAKLALNPKKLEPGKYDLIIEPYPFANLIESVGHSASIFNVESGWSFLSGQLGKQVAAKGVSIYDDATMPYGLSSSEFDSEGVPSRKTALVEDGILKHYLHNTSTAKKYKTETTANAGLIVPEPTNLVINTGRISKQEMLSSFSGLLITNIWYTRFQNYLTGDFSTIPRDGIFLYKNGKIVNPVKSIRISDNILNMFRNIADLTKEQKQNYGWEVETPVFCGSALMKGINITVSTG